MSKRELKENLDKMKKKTEDSNQYLKSEISKQFNPNTKKFSQIRKDIREGIITFLYYFIQNRLKKRMIMMTTAKRIISIWTKPSSNFHLYISFFRKIIDTN